MGIILGDFNVGVILDFVIWKGILGIYDLASCNNNARLPLEFCREHQLVLTDTIFKQKYFSLILSSFTLPQPIFAVFQFNLKTFQRI